MKKLLLVVMCFTGIVSYGQYITQSPVSGSIADVVTQNEQMQLQRQQQRQQQERFNYLKQDKEREREIVYAHFICVNDNLSTLLKFLKNNGIDFSTDNEINDIYLVSYSDDLAYYTHLFYENLGICTIIIPKHQEYSNLMYKGFEQNYQKIDNYMWVGSVNS